MCIRDRVIAADTGHIGVHEAGAIESGGHKVLTIPHKNGKLEAAAVKHYLERFYQDGSCTHMVQPGMVYISHPTEYGTLYTKDELKALRRVCEEYQLPLFLDGARLGYGLCAPGTDVTLADLAELCDVFYIGGTKVGALFGEAVVFPKKNTVPGFFTLMKQQGAVPVSYTHLDVYKRQVEYRESIFVGYRYYETFHVPVKYPFGYGLSYTSFSYSELNVPEVYSGGKIQIRFKIKNIGKVSGAEIAQLYICPIESDVIRSHIELKGFQKIYLHPGEEKEVILELDERSFSVYDVEKKAFSMLSGKYQICIGASVHDLQLKANMEVVGLSLIHIFRIRVSFYSIFNLHEACLNLGPL